MRVRGRTKVTLQLRAARRLKFAPPRHSRGKWGGRAGRGGRHSRAPTAPARGISANESECHLKRLRPQPHDTPVCTSPSVTYVLLLPTRAETGRRRLQRDLSLRVRQHPTADPSGRRATQEKTITACSARRRCRCRRPHCRRRRRRPRRRPRGCPTRRAARPPSPSPSPPAAGGAATRRRRRRASRRSQSCSSIGAFGVCVVWCSVGRCLECDALLRLALNAPRGPPKHARPSCFPEGEACPLPCLPPCPKAWPRLPPSIVINHDSAPRRRRREEDARQGDVLLLAEAAQRHRLGDDLLHALGSAGGRRELREAFFACVFRMVCSRVGCPVCCCWAAASVQSLRPAARLRKHSITRQPATCHPSPRPLPFPVSSPPPHPRCPRSAPARRRRRGPHTRPTPRRATA